MLGFGTIGKEVVVMMIAGCVFAGGPESAVYQTTVLDLHHQLWEVEMDLREMRVVTVERQIKSRKRAMLVAKLHSVPFDKRLLRW